MQQLGTWIVGRGVGPVCSVVAVIVASFCVSLIRFRSSDDRTYYSICVLLILRVAYSLALHPSAYNVTVVIVCSVFLS
jgi:hypothetical protein